MQQRFVRVDQLQGAGISRHVGRMWVTNSRPVLGAGLWSQAGRA